MKYNYYKMLGLGAALAGSAMLTSCDDDGSTVFVKEDTGVADAINDALGDKPIAPVPLAEFPVTSLKLAFDNAGTACLGASFGPGDELEIDFDSISKATSPANAQADLDITGGAFLDPFGSTTVEGYVEGVDVSGGPSTFYIANIYAGTSASGQLLLTDLTFTPLASDQRSITGRFTASAPLEVTINQDTQNVVQPNGDIGGLSIALPWGSTGVVVTKVTVYADAPGAPAEVTSPSGETVYETAIGTGNVAVSVELDNGCVLNFAVSQSAYSGAVPNGLVDAGAAATVLALLDPEDNLDVSPVGSNEIPSNIPSPKHLIAGSEDGGVTGSYRHDYDSTFGSAENNINSENELNPQ